MACLHLQQGGDSEAPASSGSSSNSQSSNSSDSSDGTSAQAAPTEGAAAGGDSVKKGKHDADRTYDDGSLLFTAESLAKVSFDDLKP